MVKIINKLKNRKGFTLIELIVVLAVLAIIMAIAVPRFIGVQKQARIDADYSTGALIAKTAELYNAKEEDKPTTASDLINKKYISELKFQSETLKNVSASAIKISIDDKGSIKVETETPAHVLYPKPTSSLITN